MTRLVSLRSLLNTDLLIERMSDPDPMKAAAARTLLEEQSARRRQRRETAQRAMTESALTRAVAREQQEQDAAAAMERLLERRYRPGARKTRAECCPACTGPACATALTCSHRFSDLLEHGIDDKPMCKFHGDREAHEAEKRRVEQRHNRLVSAGIVDREKLAVIPQARTVRECLPQVPRHLEHVLNAPRQHAAAAERFIGGEGRHILFCGTTGTWKTWALATITAERDSVRWVNAGSIRPTNEWGEEFERCLWAPYLVIPDLGTEMREGYDAAKQLALLISRRDDESLPCLIATNLTLEKIRSTYEDRIAERLERGIVSQAKGPSLRQAMKGAT